VKGDRSDGDAVVCCSQVQVQERENDGNDVCCGMEEEEFQMEEMEVIQGYFCGEAAMEYVVLEVSVWGERSDGVVPVEMDARC
jgi:hypothetical protein